MNNETATPQTNETDFVFGDTHIRVTAHSCSAKPWQIECRGVKLFRHDSGQWPSDDYLMAGKAGNGSNWSPYRIMRCKTHGTNETEQSMVDYVVDWAAKRAIYLAEHAAKRQAQADAPKRIEALEASNARLMRALEDVAKSTHAALGHGGFSIEKCLRPACVTASAAIDAAKGATS